MPDHVYHKIAFSSPNAAAILAECCTESMFDFRKFIPQPSHIYLGCLSACDYQDFPCNWDSWNKANWGTRGGAYDGNCWTDGDCGIITFCTEWSIPYPVIAAFANKFRVKFEHKYIDKFENFWGIETWDVLDGTPTRTSKARDRSGDRIPLNIELMGYDPTQDAG